MLKISSVDSYRVAQKVSHHQKIVLNRIQAC